MRSRMAASPSTRNSLLPGRKGNFRIRSGCRAATARRIPTAIREPAVAEAGPWLAIAGLGLFHGLNPAMGWLFAVALGLHRHSQRVVLVSLLPIAIGHAAAVAAVLAIALILGMILDGTTLLRLAGFILIGWAL